MFRPSLFWLPLPLGEGRGEGRGTTSGLQIRLVSRYREYGDDPHPRPLSQEERGARIADPANGYGSCNRAW